MIDRKIVKAKLGKYRIGSKVNTKNRTTEFDYVTTEVTSAGKQMGKYTISCISCDIRNVKKSTSNQKIKQ